MSNLQVNFIHPTDSSVITVTLDEYMSIQEAIDELIANDFIRPHSEGYNLCVKNGNLLHLNHTFRDSKINNNTDIRVIPATSAGCFAEGTKILLANGNTSNIEQVESKTNILTYNKETKTFQKAEVEGVYRQTYSTYMRINDSIVTSPDQVLLTAEGQWRKAGNLSEGDFIAKFPFAKTRIESIIETKDICSMMSLTTPNQECIIAEGLIAKDLIGKQSFFPRQVDVFLSYSENDKDCARSIFSQLDSAGITAFLAEKSIKPGSHWEREIKEALRSCKNCWILVTPNSLKSEWVISEWAAAWALEKTIVPILLQCSIKDLPARLQTYKSIDYHQINLLINDFNNKR